MFASRNGFIRAGLGAPAPAGDPFWDNVIMLLKANPMVNTMTQIQRPQFRSDASTYTNFAAYGGNTGVAGDSPFANSRGSVVFANRDAGSTATGVNSIQIPNLPQVTYTGDFTIECWAKPPNITQQNFSILLLATFPNDYFNNFSGGNVWRINNGGGTPNLGAANSTISGRDNVWHHHVIERAGNTIRVYIDGVAFSTTTTNTAGSARWDRFGGATNFDNQFNGLMSNVRFSNVARYNGNFTRPTQPFTWDANTNLLFAAGQDLPIMDFGPLGLPIWCNNLALTRSTSVSKWSGENSIQQATDNASGIRFIPTRSDNTGWVPNNPTACPGDFTWEAWIRVSSTASTAERFIYSSPAEFTVGKGTNQRLYVSLENTNPISFGPADIRDNNWHHIAITRSGTGTNNCRIWFDGLVDGQFTNTTSIEFVEQDTNTMTEVLGSNGTAGLPANVDSIRITKGVVRYNNNFSVPTEPFPTSA